MDAHAWQKLTCSLPDGVDRTGRVTMQSRTKAAGPVQAPPNAAYGPQHWSWGCGAPVARGFRATRK